MIAGSKERFAIEAELQEELDGWLLGRFRFWLCDQPVGDWDDAVDLRGCVRWLRDFATVARNRYEPALARATAEEVFRQLYEPVMSSRSLSSSYENAFSRFHISYVGMSSFDLFDIILLHDLNGGERCLWRRSGVAKIEECKLWRHEMETVAKEFCDLFDGKALSSPE